MKTLKVFLFLFVLAGLNVACEPKHDPPIESDSVLARQIKKALENPGAIEFKNIQKWVLDRNCVECHSGGRIEANVRLDTYENLTLGTRFTKVVFPFEPQRSGLYSTLIAKGQRHMPPLDRPQLTEEQRTLVYTWISQGAKLTKHSATQPPPTLKQRLQPYFDRPETIDFAVMEDQLIKESCFKCHSSKSGQAHDDVLLYSADLTSYDRIFNHPFVEVVKKGQPAQSPLFRSVAIEQTMPSVKDGYDLLDSYLVKLMRLWILNCAIEKWDPENPGDLQPNPDNPDKVRHCQ